MKYDAFISYRHLERDMFVAKGVHKALETAKIPRKIQKETGKKRIQRVFRDQEELPIGSNLGDNIEAALAESEFLVVICSPQTKESEWVMKEINTFIAMHGRENILAVLVDGEPYESFPAQLLVDDMGNPKEPLAADVRGANLREVKKKIKSETLRLAASILHCDYDDLKQRHRERIMRRYTMIAAGVAALGVLFGIYNAYNLARINENYQQKLVNESKVLAASSKTALENGDRETAALIALEALPGEGNERPFVPDAMFALSQALGSYSLGNKVTYDKLLTHNLPVKDFKVNVDKTRVISVDNSENVYYWNIQTGERLFMKDVTFIEGKKDDIKAVAINDSCASVASAYFLTGYDEEGNRVYEILNDEECTFAKYSSDGKVVALDFLTEIKVYDACTGKLLKRYSEDGLRYGSDMFFFKENTLFAVEVNVEGTTVIGENAEEICQIMLYDMETNEQFLLPVDRNSLLDMTYTPDGYVAYASADFDELISRAEYEIPIQKVDYKTGTTVWRTSVTKTSNMIDQSYTRLMSRAFESGGKERRDLFVSSGRSLYNFNLDTGELQAEFNAEDDIQRYYIALNADYAYVGSLSGRVNILDGSNGYNYTDSAVTVGDSLTDFVIGSGYVIASQHLSPDIIVMSDIKDESYEGTYPIGSTLYSVLGSPSGENYAVLTSSDTYQYGISVDVHDTATGEQLAFFDIERAYSMDVKYVDDDTLVLPTYDKTICYLHIDSGELETIELEEDHFTDYLNSGDDTKRVAISNNEYKIFDIKEKKFVSSGKICEELYDCKFYRGIVDNSCKHLYYRSTEYVAYKFDFDTNEREIILDNFKVVGFAVSKDDSKLAVMCSDGFIRVVDAQTMEVCNVVENYGSENSFMQFSDDGTKLYYQGLDYYFKIYDLVNKKMIYISDGQWQSASYVKEYPAKNMLVFRNSNAIHILDTESYGVMLEAEKGDLYLENEDAILSGYSGELYKYKLKSLDELISEAKEKYGDKKLSVEKRLKYKLY